jgi:hypothetical protein
MAQDGVYVTVAEVRAEGVPADVPDARISNRILKWEAIVEQITNNIFRVINPGELRFDGNDSDILHFNLALVAVTSLRINDETVAVDTDEYIAFTGNEKPNDDRKNPKIQLRPLRESIFRRHSSIFVRGLDQFVTATWGHVDGGTDTPLAIKAAIIQLVVLDLDGYFEQAGGGGTPAISQKRREKTDDHEIEYFEVEDRRVVWQSIPADVADILAMYRAPWAINVPSPPRYLHAVSLGVSIYSVS